ncbi:MAG TPA: inorganic diphosphatase [Gammaproteobacteria bacterium]|nr:inorganic diphosphatase [Gammaproteobacteria bacterium]
MNIDNISAGDNLPEEFNVLIEIPNDGGAVKYEFDKSSGALVVDRFFGTSLHYPANYGLIPHTLSEDGDPIDVLVITPVPLLSGSLISCRALGMLDMEDESGIDYKVLAVPVDRLSGLYLNKRDIHDLPESLLNEIAHFFEQYKALEPGKWAKVRGWENAENARMRILESYQRYQEESAE